MCANVFRSSRWRPGLDKAVRRMTGVVGARQTSHRPADRGWKNKRPSSGRPVSPDYFLLFTACFSCLPARKCGSRSTP